MFVGSERICFTPGFPVKSAKVGDLSVLNHMFPAKFQISLFHHYNLLSFSDNRIITILIIIRPTN